MLMAPISSSCVIVVFQIMVFQALIIRWTSCDVKASGSDYDQKKWCCYIYSASKLFMWLRID